MDFTSVYCEICEIFNICNIWYPLLNLCVQVSTGCRLQERRGRDHCIDLSICILFSETINRLRITFIYIVHLDSKFSFFDLDFWILHKSSIYLMKSLAICRFVQYFCGFHPWLLWNPHFYNIKVIFDFQFVNNQMVILVFVTISSFSLSSFFWIGHGVWLRHWCCLPLLAYWVFGVGRGAVETSGFPSQGTDCDLLFGVGKKDWSGWIQYCLKSLYFIIILMKSLCCLSCNRGESTDFILIHSLHF